MRCGSPDFVATYFSVAVETASLSSLVVRDSDPGITSFQDSRQGRCFANRASHCYFAVSNPEGNPLSGNSETCRFVRHANAVGFITTLAFTAMAGAEENARAKLAEDPTQIVTQLGVSYGGSDVRLSGSLGLDSVRKINASTQTDGNEWRIGGSWLFDVGIANFKFRRNEFDNGASQTSYSVGTFFPLSRFGFEPAGWQSRLVQRCIRGTTTRGCLRCGAGCA
jgi:hypothetical protein